METYEQDGIVYFQKPYHVNYLDFLYQHIDCDMIIQKEKNGICEEVDVVAYASSKEYNDLLWKVFYDHYGDGNYVIGSHINKERMNAMF